jgi:hypothetical protein
MRKHSTRPSSEIEAVCPLIFAALFVASGPVAAKANVAVPTYHYDNLRTGWNSSETDLAASTFPPHFGVTATVALDDQVEAQPLVVPGLNIAGATTKSFMWPPSPIQSTQSMPRTAKSLCRPISVRRSRSR